ncbi:hypothetical protein ACFX13_021710 [Malus domestica]|uniref:Uncharacterized protein n=1 Tax=Malus domestica TaxID=3750 RepID=A0A498HMT3_MALDO|nr:hypothetical protein DVH24_033797 [Malus domestica]
MTWCAVEYCEASGAILHKLLQHHSPNIPHYGRTLIHQAILCNNERAVEECLKILASDGADFGLVNSAGQSASVIAESASKRKPLCQPLISLGAKCDIANARYETALLLARKSNGGGSEPSLCGYLAVEPPPSGLSVVHKSANEIDRINLQICREDFAELSVRWNLEVVVVGWERGFPFLGLNRGSLEMEMAALRLIPERLESTVFC